MGNPIPVEIHAIAPPSSMIALVFNEISIILVICEVLLNFLAI